MSVINLVKDTDVNDPRVSAVFNAVRREYGFVPNIIRVVANCPELLEVFVPFWARVYESPRIGGRLRAIAALGTAHSRDCKYCIAHMSESARRAGLDDDELAAIARRDGDAILSKSEQAVLNFATALSCGNGVSSEAATVLSGTFNSAEVVNITLAVGLYNLTSLFLQSLDIEVDEVLSGGVHNARQLDTRITPADWEGS